MVRRLTRRSGRSALAWRPAPCFAHRPCTAPRRLPTLRLDYAYYNPVALVLKDKGWVEEEFGKDGTKVEWVLSLGSNKALEFLNGSVVDFGSTRRRRGAAGAQQRHPDQGGLHLFAAGMDGAGHHEGLRRSTRSPT